MRFAMVLLIHADDVGDEASRINFFKDFRGNFTTEPVHSK